jgi:CheY-like chemotaxis protein
MASENFIRSAESLILKCVEQTGERLASLVGGEVAFHPDGIAPLTAADYTRKNRKKAAVLLMESPGDGHAMVLIRMQEAILLAGTLLMMPQNQLKEIIKSGEMGQDLNDAFNEVANIVYGAVDELTHDMSPENGKLRNEGVQLIDPSRESDLATLWPKGATYGGELSVSFPGFESSSAFLVFDETLLSLVTGVSAEEPPPEGKSAAEVLLFCVDSAIAGDLNAFFAEKGMETREFDDADQAVRFLAQKPVMVVAGFRPGDEAAAEKVCDAARSGKTGVPVVGVSGNPTRETILLARKTGVKAFLVHPFSGDTLRTKVAPFLAACVKS